MTEELDEKKSRYIFTESAAIKTTAARIREAECPFEAEIDALASQIMAIDPGIQVIPRGEGGTA